MLELANVSVDIDGSRILQGVDLSVKAGELVVLVGRNGAGKTTLLNTIMGYRRTVTGTISLNGQTISGSKTHQIAKLGIGFSPEESEVFSDLTVQQNLELPTWTRKSETSAVVREELGYSVFPKLNEYRHRQGNHLSGGERKMVSIARALSLDPEILLLDEPFEGLSPAIIPSIAKGVASICSSGRAILMVESNFQHIPKYVNRLYVLERGEIVFVGSYSDAKNDARVATIVSGLA